ncbi:MAG TPA: outer membrane beta-barrel protein [Burkholderiales bacterium]|nr:outer membrane beta-barrel protein [Burkholderiales bacterium]
MSTTRNLIAATTLLCACLAPAARADSGVYIGGGIGASQIDDKAGTPAGTSFSASDFAYKGFLGYYFDAIPLLRLAGEVGYRDLGEPEDTSAGVASSYRMKGLDYSVLAGVGLGPVDLFARAGGMSYDLTKTHAGVGRDFHGTAPLVGAGVWFSVFGIGVRAEYEYIDVDELDGAQMVSVSAFYKF